MIKVKADLAICAKCRKTFNPEWEMDLAKSGIIAFGCPGGEMHYSDVKTDEPYPPKFCPKIFEHLVSAGLSVNIDKRGGDA